MALEFCGKARTLKALQGSLSEAKIASIVFFNVFEWRKKASDCLMRVQQLGVSHFAVRSCCVSEDHNSASNAGAFLSLLDVDSASLKSSIEQVIASYESENLNNEVLIQPMIESVIASGVAFSHDPNTCSPYRVFNWHEGKDTTHITSGLGGQVWQEARYSKQVRPSLLDPVVRLIDELEELFETALDIEFAVDQDRTLWLLQVRPLILNHSPETAMEQTERLTRIEQKVRMSMQPHPFLMGRKTVFGVMPDWNPAEIIGLRPKPLSLSIYKELVTDSIWAYQRHNYGYRNLRSFPLLIQFSGMPYVDVRLSFNSFVPSELDEAVANRLVDFYIDQLLDKPSAHDKIEFEVVFSCYTFDLKENIKRLEKAGFSSSECEMLVDSLRNLTNRIIHPEKGLWKSDAKKLDVLNSRRQQVFRSGMDKLSQIYWLLEDIKRYGTLPFAGLARAGFIAVQMLKSLVAVDILSQSDYDAFMASVNTVSSQLIRDRELLDKTSFLSRYGHLRPGTYEIASYRYDERPELYFDWNTEQSSSVVPSKEFSLTLSQMKRFKALLAEHGLNEDPVLLLEFIKSGIELRELSKYYFTQNLSDALSLMSAYGEELGFSREDLSYCDVFVFKELYTSTEDPRSIIEASIAAGKQKHRQTSHLALPPLITDPMDVWGFHWPDMMPNFITQKSVVASVQEIKEGVSLDGMIVFIPSADPGYDWLFSHPIAGLITAWGGVNSHMAIRAGELSIPAAIGVGERLYNTLSQSHKILLDCAGQRLEVLQ